MINNYIITTENESLQKIVISKNEQVEELQSMLEMKEERMKEFESQLTGKNKILHDSKLINDIRSLKSGECHDGECNSENMVCLILFTNNCISRANMQVSQVVDE